MNILDPLRFFQGTTGEGGTVIFNTHESSDGWRRQKRTIDKKYWKWLRDKRKTAFTDFIYELFDGFHMENGSLAFDPPLPDKGGWWAETGLAIANWASGKDPRHVKKLLNAFLKWGQDIFKCARFPVVPAMPEFDKPKSEEQSEDVPQLLSVNKRKYFMETRPFSKKPSRTKSRKAAISTKKI